MDLRWQRGDSVGLEDYLDAFPELANERNHFAALLYHEYCLRQQRGDRAGLAAFQVRFPDYFDQFEAIVREAQTASGQDTHGPAAPAPAPAASPSPTPVGPAMLGTQGGRMLTAAGGYKLLERLGLGSFGEVWRAEAPGGVPVAIKIIFRPIDHDEAQRELKSLELIKRLRHPFLVQVQAYWAMEDRLLIVMDLGEATLQQRLKTCRAEGLPGIPYPELLGYMHDAAEALDYLHEQGVLHRDVKPANLLIFGRHAKVADFGLARLLDVSPLHSATRCGTPAFMAPEMWQGQPSAPSDQYGLAATYVMLRLDRPLFPTTGGMMQVWLDHEQNAPDLKALDPAEQEPLLKALAKAPTDRYATCREFVQALAEALGTRSHTQQATASKPATSRNEPVAPAAYGSLSSIGGAKLGASAPAAVPIAEQPSVRPSWQGGSSAQAVHRWSAWRRYVAILTAVVLGLVVAGVIWKMPKQTPEPGFPAPKSVTNVTYVPPGFTAVGTDMMKVRGQVLSTRIARMLGDKQIVFVLIPENQQAPALDPFYIMENKVSNELFAQFAKTPGRNLHSNGWQRGATGPGNKPLGIEGQEKLPVFNVSIQDAVAFAKSIGGVLPSAEQWDKAGGRYDKPLIGPYTDRSITGKIGGYDHIGPLPTDRSDCPVSYLGCRDMAGNGEEWTRTVWDEHDPKNLAKLIPPNNTDAQLPILLRGASYNDKQAYVFGEDPDQLGYGETKPYVTFRVVIELPEVSAARK